jgi:outer membrane receptor protein involved in Fe transport
VTLGLQTRADLIDELELHRTVARTRVGTVRADRVRQTGTGLFAQAESRWAPRLRTVLGVRADGYTFTVRSDRAENSGRRRAAIVSPKASLAVTLSPGAELYASGGYGFHSNDARGTTITTDPASGDAVSRVHPLVRSRGAELGMRATPVRGLRSTLTAWMLNLDSELVFTGDGGTTEPSAASRRAGLTIANFYRPWSSLALDADVSFARARFHDMSAGVTHVPGALERVVAAGMAWTPPTGAFGALRLRHFGAYPLVEDNALRARASTLLNADAGWRLPRGARVQANVLNLLDARADDIQYFYASRLSGESAEGVGDVHFHPAEPRQLRVSLGLTF